MTLINIILGVIAFISLCFVLGETDPPMSEAQRQGATIAFVGMVVLIIAVNTIM